MRSDFSLKSISPSRFFPHKERYEIFDGSENLVEKIEIFVQDFIHIRTALKGGSYKS